MIPYAPNQYSVVMYVPGGLRKTVLVAVTREQAKQFAAQCRAETNGCHNKFRVTRRNVFQEIAEQLEGRREAADGKVGA